MHLTKTTAAVTALLCIAPLAVSYAQSNTELFAPATANLAFNDGKGATTGILGGIGYEVIGGHAIAEGDMVLGRVDGRGNVLGNTNRGLGQSRLLDRWDNGIIAYQFSADITADERELAEQAVQHWNDNTSINMVAITDENQAEFENYLLFESSNGCASYVGMRGGEQQLWISASCGVGSIIHEIGHAVGLFHEHTRADRDNFISVQWNNIVPGKEFNFDVLNANVTTLGEYDYGSIMHYGERFFSTNNESTITVLDGVSEIGQRIALSEADIQSVNEMYATDLALRVNAGSPNGSGELNADINVSNQGGLGANGLSLALTLGDGGTWLATSTNPGWECAANGPVLNCERDTLEASVTSVFTVAAQTNGTSGSSLSVELTSNTFDTDYGNNGHNATVTQPAANEPEAQAATPEETGGAFNQPSAQELEEQTETIDEQPETEATNEATNQPVVESENGTETDAEGDTVAPVDTVQPIAAPDIAQLPAQQSSQPIVTEAETTGVTSEPGTPAQALPEVEIAAATPTSSSGGGAFSPLGGVALFLLTFVARVRRKIAG